MIVRTESENGPSVITMNGVQVTIKPTKDGVDIKATVYGYESDDEQWIVPTVSFKKEIPVRFPCAVCRFCNEHECCKPEEEPCPNGMGR